MANNTVEIKLLLKDQISASYSKARKTIVKENTKTTDSLKKLEKQSNATGLSLKSIVGAALGFVAFRQMNQYISDAISLSNEHEQSTAKLEQVLKSTGYVAGVTSRDMKKLASELSDLTTFTEPAIEKGEALLLTFTNLSADILPQTTEMMLNMSTAMDGDVKSAAIQLGKALNDPTKGLSALSEVGVSFTAAQGDMIKALQKDNDMLGAQQIILAELETEFGGMAKAMAETDAGKMINFGKTLDEMKETLGKDLTPSIIKLQTEFLNLVTAGGGMASVSAIFITLVDTARLFNSIIGTGIEYAIRVSADQAANAASQAFATAEHNLKLATAAKLQLKGLKGFDEARENEIKAASKVKDLLEKKNETAEAYNNLKNEELAITKFIKDLSEKDLTTNVKAIQDEIAATRKLAEEKAAIARAELNKKPTGGVPKIGISDLVDAYNTRANDVLRQIELNKATAFGKKVVALNEQFAIDMMANQDKSNKAKAEKNIKAEMLAMDEYNLIIKQYAVNSDRLAIEDGNKHLALLETIRRSKLDVQTLELEDLKAKNDAELQIFDDYNYQIEDKNKVKEELEQLHKDRLAEINDKYNKEYITKLEVIAQRERDVKMGIAAESIKLAKTVFGEHKLLFLAEQSLAAARVTFNTLIAASQALTLPPPGAGIPLAALIKWQGGLAVATILAQTIKGFEDGGILNGPSTSGDKTLYRGNAGEMIFNKAQQKNLYKMATNGTGGSSGNVITFEAPNIYVATGDPRAISAAVGKTYQEKVQELAEMLKDVEINKL